MSEIKPTYEQLVGVLKRSFFDGIVKMGEIGNITRGMFTYKAVSVTFKEDKRKGVHPEMHIPASHANCFVLEDLMFNPDGSILMSFTLHPERY